MAQTHDKSEDNVTQVALLAGHCAARMLLLLLVLLLVWVRVGRLALLREALFWRGALHLGDCREMGVRLRRRLESGAPKEGWLARVKGTPKCEHRTNINNTGKEGGRWERVREEHVFPRI